MGNQMETEQMQSLPQGRDRKFSEIVEQQLQKFTDDEVHAFLDQVVEEVNTQYAEEEAKQDHSKLVNTFKVQPISHITSLYHMKQKIAGGSSCSVYKATDLQFGDDFAVKQLPKSQKYNARLFRKEVEMLSALNHPSIVELEACYEDKRRFYLASEYLSGGTLFERLLRDKILDEDDARECIESVLSALAYIHAKNIAHRDIKCKNLVFKKDGRLKLIDFGDAEQLQPDKKYFDFVGTLHYLSPESARKRSAETMKKSDMWAVGVVAYILCCGRLPFGGSSRKKTIQRIINHDGDIFFPDDIDLSESCKDFINQLLCPDPEQRLSAAEALEHKWVAGTPEITMVGVNSNDTLLSPMSPAALSISYSNGGNSVNTSFTPSLSGAQSSNYNSMSPMPDLPPVNPVIVSKTSIASDIMSGVDSEFVYFDDYE